MQSSVTTKRTNRKGLLKDTTIKQWIWKIRAVIEIKLHKPNIKGRVIEQIAKVSAAIEDKGCLKVSLETAATWEEKPDLNQLVHEKSDLRDQTAKIGKSKTIE